MLHFKRKTRMDILNLPSFEDVENNKEAFIDMFHLFYNNNDPNHCPRVGSGSWRSFPGPNQTRIYASRAMDRISFGLWNSNDIHIMKRKVPAKALDTIKFSIWTHQGYGDAIFRNGRHEGRTVHWRSKDSILSEARSLS